MPDVEIPDTLRDDLRAAWHRYVDMLVPLRPDLHRYCRWLAGNIWDAEDLVQDTLVRAFGRWGVTYPEVREPRAYLLRTATNVWIDTLRRREKERAGQPVHPEQVPAAGANPETASTVRDASARLLQALSPQERAALVLKEVFDMTLEEIADLLATTTGAVKAALHRGRDRLRDDASDAARRRPAPSPELLDRFIERYNARDVAGLVALMLDGGTAENVGNSFHVGRRDPSGGTPTFLHKVVHGHDEWPPQTRPESVRIERAELDGEPIIVFLVTRWGAEALEVVFRLEEQDERIARLRAYGFCPETVQAVGDALGMAVRTGLYRAPTPAPGADWPE
ncbi:MAG TPA: sigma-70 family RNA polymerase sigma factor [Candidatus Binatia bacterium]|nr:sigma-70 family RNA polymerase sigma factor [Candidatus Binatia bacterium]